MSAALQRALGAAGPGPAPAPALVLGPARSGRSALLFRAALAGPRALFLAPRALQRLPGARRGESDARGLQRIQFLYPPSLRELLRLLASLHQSLPGPPALLLLDGLEQYLAGCPGPQAVARLSALLVDTASYFTGRLGADPQGSATCCQLIASMQVSGETEVEDYLCILQRYFPAQCWLCPDSAPALGQEDCGGDRTFRARLSQPGAADQEWKLGFNLDGEMRVSPVPWGHAEDLGAASDTDRAAGAEK
ncbi:ATPase SWSAP1 [Malaclemys terrapin pileata]|uniref:ATPase SWSAP1 n=1 Tax=Malaclemys terrapin pileata TaxID=2991368 RepID=UPI0023A7A7CC|nr:ATPase SWSAP1 [Malaclemys terrapin pileata]